MLTVAISAPQHVGEDLAPERAGGAAARGADLGRRRHPGGHHQVEPVAQPERDALEDGPGEVPPVVGERQADERARGRAGRGAGCARRRGRAGTAARRCRPGPAPPRRPAPRTARPARPRRGTSAGCRRPRASPTSCASGPARRGRRRGPGPPARTAARRSSRTRRPTCRATAPRGRAPRRPPRPRWPPGRRRPPRPASRRAGRSPRRPSRTTVAGHLRPLERRRHPRGVDAQRVEHHRRPVAGGEVEQQRPGAVGLVERVSAGQPVADVVLGQQHVGDAGPDLRLVLANPDQLGGGEPGQRVVAGDLDEPLRADGRADLVALGGRALVVPQDRRPQDRRPRRRAARARASAR